MTDTSNNWDDLCKEYWERKVHIFEAGQWTDCNFLVGTGPDQEIIGGYKAVLAMASPVFEAMLYGTMAEQNQILVTDIQPETFRALLKYMCTEKVEISSIENSWDLYYGAKKYMLHLLASECVKYILEALDPQNVCRGYELANLLGDQIIIEKCLQIMRTSTDKVLSEENIREVELGTLVTIFQQESLYINSELDLYNVVVKYAKAHGYCPTTSQLEIVSQNQTPACANCDAKNPEIKPTIDLAETLQNQVTSSSSSKEQLDLEISKISLRTALREIRFLTLTSTEFAEAVSIFPLFNDVEMAAIFMNIILPTCGKPMPDGFSISRECRWSIVEVQCQRCAFRYRVAAKDKDSFQCGCKYDI